MSTTRVRALRVGAVLLLTAGTACLSTAPAHADSATIPAVKTNWYWTLAKPTVNGTALPAAPPTQTSGVADGDLGVGYTVDQAGTYDKVAAVAFDLSAVPMGSTFTRFSVSVPYDSAAHQLTNGTPDVSACGLLDTFLDAPGPSDIATAPPESLPSCVKGAFDAKLGKAGGYTFDLTAVANDWSGGAPANGVLIRPTANLASAQQPFTLSLLGKNAISVTADFTPPQVMTPVDVAMPPVAPAPAPQAPQTVVLSTVPNVPVSVPAAAPAPAPQVVAGAATVPLAAPAAYRQGALVPSGAWWLGALALLAMLGLAAAVLGDPLAPVVVDARRRRFAEVVRTSRVTSSRTSPRVLTV